MVKNNQLPFAMRADYFFVVFFSIYISKARRKIPA
jgi:hypothetical protein